MPNIPFIDLHTHQIIDQENVVSVLSHNLFDPLPQVDAPHFFSSGAHPWFIKPSMETDSLVTKLKKLSQEPRFLCIGEIGLDRLKGASLDVQTLWLENQIEYACTINSPAVILHCVRAFDLFLAILKKSKYGGAFIFHDYSGNASITKALINDPRVYFSLGNSIHRQNSSEHFFSLNLGKIFFETDDSDRNIKESYSTFSKRSGVDLNELKSAVGDNFSRLFTPISATN